jgi:hypothetical protein
VITDKEKAEKLKQSLPPGLSQILAFDIKSILLIPGLQVKEVK